MAGPLNAKVIMARCSKTRKYFGIRIEQRENDWVRTWAFPIDEQKARHEGFDANKVSGSMQAVDDYPGCPHCGNMNFAKCYCEKLSCYPVTVGSKIDDNAKHTCPWCMEEVELCYADGSIEVSGGGY